MNILPIEKRVQIIHLLVEGNSMRSTARIADVSILTVSRLLVKVGRACEDFHNETVKGLQCKRVQADEIWSFVYAKQKNVPEHMENERVGDTWTWTAIDADSKLVVSWAVGSRTWETGVAFMQDVASRISTRMQLTTDGLHAYLEAVTESFGAQIDYAQLVKLYGNNSDTRKANKRYSPADCVGTKKQVISGNPDEGHISTSYIERQNLTMRMHMRRFTRLTNGFSKKIDNHCHAIALHFYYYNWVKIHSTLRITPAMAAGLTKRFMTIEEIVRLAEK